MENKVTADYLDEEGCLHCGICGKRKQMKVSLMGFEHVVSCLCECEVKPDRNLMRRCSGKKHSGSFIRENPSDFGKEDFGNGNLKMTMEAIRRY